MNRHTAILVLGDQLSWHNPALNQVDAEHAVVILAEVGEEATYVRHNRHKIALLFSAMRHFAARLREQAIRSSTSLSSNRYRHCWLPVRAWWRSGDASA